MSRMRVLVCGTNYGQAYLAALARNPRKYELAGILAQGSLRSHAIAAVNGVPLYRSTDVIPGDIHLACAAMSSSAFPVVLQLMRRGIHILCEHPYAPDLLKKALDVARKRSLQFHVNGHFANLPASGAFIRACRQPSKLGCVEFVEVMTTERALYAALDIIMCAVGATRLPRVRVVGRSPKFVLMEGTLGKVPLFIAVQVSGKQGRGRLADGSSGYLLDQRLTVIYPTGVLTLLSTAGPVVWNRNLQGLSSKERLWTALSGQQSHATEDLQEQRIQANMEALDAIRKSILGNGTPETQRPQHILQVSKAWESIGRQLYCS